MANRTDYFALISAQTACCVQASALLASFFDDYRFDRLPEQKEAIHTIEHQADELHHEIMQKLSTEFLTPIEQEDIVHLVQIIDDVTDALDNVLLECYMYHMEQLPQGAKEFSRQVLSCVQTLHEAAGELKSFKKPAQLRTLLVNVNTKESQADEVYIEAVHNLFGNEHDVRRLLGGKAIFDSMEACCDQCEHAADVIDQIIMKNS